MDEKTIKTIIKQEFNFCLDIMKDIEKHNGSEEIQRYAQEWAEIESPVVGGTDAPWIRISWDGIYIFMDLNDDEDDGDDDYHLEPGRTFQLDFLGLYGAELIDCDNIEEFYKDLDNLSYEAILETLEDIPRGDMSGLIYEPMRKRGN